MPVTAKVISISDELRKTIDKNGKFGETPSDVILRLIKKGKKK